MVETTTLTPSRLHCLRLLTVANSAAAGARRQLTSVRNALVMLGLNQLRGWLQLMVFADLAGGSSELFSAALIRARCELLASNRVGMSSDTAFTTGLVSSLDVLLGQPIEWIVARMGLGDDLHFALTAGTGPLGALIDAVRRYEHGNPGGLGDYDTAELAQAFLAGVEWSRRSESFTGQQPPEGQSASA